jgi:hypothetical protein
MWKFPLIKIKIEKKECSSKKEAAPVRNCCAALHRGTNFYFTNRFATCFPFCIYTKTYTPDGKADTSILFETGRVTNTCRPITS